MPRERHWRTWAAPASPCSTKASYSPASTTAPSTLAGLSERLFECGVLPYYLHQLDPVQGAAHFAVADTRAIALMERLRVRLPGYLVPRLVREVPGEAFKRPLG